MVLGETGINRTDPAHTVLARVTCSGPSALGLVPIPPTSGGHQIPEGDSRPDSYQVIGVGTVGAEGAAALPIFSQWVQTMYYATPNIR